MGHTRLGWIPKTRRWRSLVSLATDGFSGGGIVFNGVAESHGGPPSPENKVVAAVAASTLNLTTGALDRACSDRIVAKVFFTMARIALASRKENWCDELAQVGIHLSVESGPMDLAAEFSRCIWEYGVAEGLSSDAAEQAVAAAQETLADVSRAGNLDMFSSSGEELRRAIKAVSTKEGFATLAQSFFAGFLAKYINFYLSRITPAMTTVGPVSAASAVTLFNDALRLHCKQSALIVRDFAGGWYAKTEYEEGITLSNAKRFVAIALKKLKAELSAQWQQVR